jgi:hypothetical protein
VPTCRKWYATFNEKFVERILADNQDALNWRYAMNVEGVTVSDAA